jgi:subtilisin family serine protease
MFSNRSHVIPVLSSFLSYLLVMVLCIPFTTTVRANLLVKPLSLLPEPQNIPEREGELLVRFRGGVSQRDKDTILATLGVNKVKELRGGSGFEKVELSGARDAKTAALELLMKPQVEFAEPNFLIAKDDLTPNDPQFNEQWALRNTGQSGGQYGSDINASGAWQTTTGSSDTVIAVIDSGIDFTHPDLANNQWTNLNPTLGRDLHGWDYIADNGVIKDEQGHGTAVAGNYCRRG